MNGIGISYLPARSRLASIAAGALALLGSFAMPSQAQAGYYEDYGANPCAYRCGYPAYRYYPSYRRHYGCYSCRPHLLYERRYVEREYVERRYGYGYRHHYRHYPYYGYGRNYGYYPYSGYRPTGYGYGYAGIGRRWAPTYAGYGAYDSDYEAPPRPPEPIYEPEE
jgi:hypothetical protein